MDVLIVTALLFGAQIGPLILGSSHLCPGQLWFFICYYHDCCYHYQYHSCSYDDDADVIVIIVIIRLVVCRLLTATLDGAYKGGVCRCVCICICIHTYACIRIGIHIGARMGFVGI